MIERLPTPWGLVRSGVAPDHPKIKSVTRVYEKTAAHPRFRYFGNVTFGEHVSREDLLRALPRDRLRDRLARRTARSASPAKSCPARTRRPSSSAGTTATPTTPTSRSTSLSAERAVVIGNGNVAIDVARMLVLTPEELAPTDTADHALEVLARSARPGGRRPRPPRAGAGGLHEPRAARARRAGRRRRDRRRRRSSSARWPCTTRPPSRTSPRGATSRSCASTPSATPTPGTQADRAALPALAGRAARRRARARSAPSSSCATSSSPTTSGALRAQRDRRARDDRRPGSCSARSATAASRCPGVPFDERRGVIPNEGGRVVRRRQRRAAAGRVRRRLDQARPLRRDRHEQEGRAGDGRRDARRPRPARGDGEPRDGAQSAPSPSPDAEALEPLLRERQPDLVTYEGWEAIDRHERALGEPAGRPRVKLTRIEEMLRVAAAEEP